MLPSQYRLRRSRDFVRVRRFGRSSGTPLLALYVLPNRSTDLRIGFSASKRVGKATVRNRVKRLMRESVRPRLSELRDGQDLVFVARPAAAHASYPQMCEAVGYALKKARATAEPARSVRNA